MLDVADDALSVEEEGLRQLEHRVATRYRAIGVQQRHEAVERERVEEAPDACAVLEEIDGQEHRIGRARDALHGWHFLAAGHAPSRPEVDHHHLPAQVAELCGLAVRRVPLEVRRDRADAGRRCGVIDHTADHADLRRSGEQLRDRERGPQERGERGDRDRADDDRGDNARHLGAELVGNCRAHHVQAYGAARIA